MWSSVRLVIFESLNQSDHVVIPRIEMESEYVA